ncbi:TPA: glycosyltransferase family 2 protein [Streptococcus suis]
MKILEEMMYSVVIPAYNCEKTIVPALESVRNQTRFDLVNEIILINDGSLDATNTVILDYIFKNPNMNIRYFSQENKGVSYTRNRGIRLAKSDWIALLDSDDLWLPHKLERQHSELQKNGKIKFIGSTFPLKILWKKRTGLCKLTPKELCLRSMPATPSVIFNKKVGLDLGLFKEDMGYCEDINFFQKFLLLDSYYVLAENLITINVGKNYHGAFGLSSNLDDMHQGRHQNVKELYKLGLISKPFMYLIFFFNTLKLLRRKSILLFNQLKEGR